MKTLYLECAMGAAGDMLMAALLEVLPDLSGFLREINNAGIPGVKVAAEPAARCGVRGTRIRVTIHGQDEADQSAHESHEHSSLCELEAMIAGLRLPETVKENCAAVYRLLAGAESAAHGVEVAGVHFHEVGAMDAVADIAGVCLALEKLAPEIIQASPVHAGCGHVRCAHGLLPVPAPATALLLQGIPIYGGAVKGELCTPTGAALLKFFAAGYGEMPVMTVEKTGYGMGAREYDRANCLRAFWGESRAPGDEMLELSCNIDDMSPEHVAFAQHVLLERGARDVCVLPAVMKKGRAGVVLHVLCEAGRRDEFLPLLFRYTSTLGVRESACRRHVLRRETSEVATPYGQVRVKTAEGYGVVKNKPEYEDIAKIARENNMSLHEAAALLNFMGDTK